MILYAAPADRSLEVAKLSLGECSVYGRSDRDVLVYLCWICCGLLCGRCWEKLAGGVLAGYGGSVWCGYEM